MAARRLLWIVNEHYYDDADTCEPAISRGEGQGMLVELHVNLFDLCVTCVRSAAFSKLCVVLGSRTCWQKAATKGKQVPAHTSEVISAAHPNGDRKPLHVSARHWPHLVQNGPRVEEDRPSACGEYLDHLGCRAADGVIWLSPDVEDESARLQ
eukprot:CAMPEP_0115839062 /NCGR_PEP_ID=MMETSP0287-20121206/6059_1 /TAXON_ID=412157 /ORGANISM="Chrysochromulina rotalis, Strain UIO044" /LENGTH=152 /DNA_ID=CAMNT_0003292625 /DNA_START=290 /DNA_END=748 /DNA_ORIENTATION=+